MQTILREVKLHKIQDQFSSSPASYRGFVGGRGAGKSWIGAFDLLMRAKAGRTYLVGSPTGILMNDTTYPTFKAIAMALGLFVSEKLTPYPNVTIVAEEGTALVRFRTAEDPERMRGPNLSGVWLDEASLMDEAAYTVCIGSLREAGEQGWLSATFTPKGLNSWTYRVFGKNTADTAIFHASTRANPFNPPGFHDKLAHQYGPALAQQELEGVFCDVAGAEFPSDWFPDSHWVPAFPDELTLRVMYLDPSLGSEATPIASKGGVKRLGDYSAYVMLARDKQGMLYASADLARRPTTQIVSDGIQLARDFQPLDAFGVESNTFQRLLADDLIRQSRERGIALPIYNVTNNTKKEDRIRRITPYLSRGLIRWVERPGTRLMVQQLREFPMGEFDDGPDALEGVLRIANEVMNGRQRGIR
jgi:predicted phage terminase large subunit-like protein